jgi:hypothetical protein
MFLPELASDCGTPTYASCAVGIIDMPSLFVDTRFY